MARHVCTIPRGVDCEVADRVVGVGYDEEASMLILHLEPIQGRKTAVYVPVDKAVANKLTDALA